MGNICGPKTITCVLEHYQDNIEAWYWFLVWRRQVSGYGLTHCSVGISLWGGLWKEESQIFWSARSVQTEGLASVALSGGNLCQRVPSTIAVKNVQCFGDQGSRQIAHSEHTKPDIWQGIQWVVDEERGEKLEPTHSGWSPLWARRMESVLGLKGRNTCR